MMRNAAASATWAGRFSNVCNNGSIVFRGSDTRNVDVHRGLYHLGSLFNHSCAPNAEWHHRGAQLVVKSLVELVPLQGTELSISYVDLASESIWAQDVVGEEAGQRGGVSAGEQYMCHAATAWSEKAAVAGQRRRQKLYGAYHFICNCCRCNEECGHESVQADGPARTTQPVSDISVQKERQGATGQHRMNLLRRE
jgi:hypothetical protein